MKNERTTAMLLLSAAIIGCAGNAEVGISEAGWHNDPVFVGTEVRPEGQVTVHSKLKLPAACFLNPRTRVIAVGARYELELGDDSGTVIRLIEDSRDYLVDDFRRFGRLSEMVFWELADNAGALVPPGEYGWRLRVQYHFLGDGSLSERCIRTINGRPIEEFRVGERHVLVEDEASGRISIMPSSDETALLQSVEMASNRLLDETFHAVSNEREQRYRIWAARYGHGIGRLNVQPGDYGTLLYLGGLDLRIPVAPQATGAETALEFFRTHRRLWPVDERLDDLEIVDVTREIEGHEDVILRQTHGGVPVMGTETVVAIEPAGRVTSVAGFQVTGITESATPTHSLAEAVEEVRAAFPEHRVDVEDAFLAYMPEAGARRGPLVWVVPALGPETSGDRFAVSAHDLEILDHLEYHNLPSEGAYPLSWPENPPDELKCKKRTNWADTRLRIVLRGNDEIYNENSHLLMDYPVETVTYDFCMNKLCKDELHNSVFPACSGGLYASYEWHKENASIKLKIDDLCKTMVEFQNWINDTGFKGPYLDLCVDVQVRQVNTVWDWEWHPIGQSPAYSSDGWYQCVPTACNAKDVMVHEVGHAMTPVGDLYYNKKWSMESAEILADMIAMAFDDKDWTISEDKLRICPDTSCGFCEEGYPTRSWDAPEDYYPVRESAPWHPGQFTDYRTYMSDSEGNIGQSTEIQHINGTAIGQAFYLFSDGGQRNNMIVKEQGRGAYTSLVLSIFNGKIPGWINYDTWRRLVLDRIPQTVFFTGQTGPFSHTRRGSMMAAFDAVQLWSLPEINTLVPPGYRVTQAAGSFSTREYKVSPNGVMEFREKPASEPWSPWKQVPVSNLEVNRSGGGIRSFSEIYTTWWSWTNPDTDGIVVTRAGDDPFSTGWVEESLEQRVFLGDEFLHNGDPVIAEYLGKPYVVFARNDGCLVEMHPEGDDWKTDDWSISDCLVEETVNTTPAVVRLYRTAGPVLVVVYKAVPDTEVYSRVHWFEIGPGGPTSSSVLQTPGLDVLNSWCEGCTEGLTCPANTVARASFSQTVSPPAVVNATGGNVVIAWVDRPEKIGGGATMRSYVYTTITNFEPDGWGEHVRTPLWVIGGAEPNLGFIDGRLYVGLHGWAQIGEGWYFGGLFHATQYLGIPDLIPLPGGPIDPPGFWGM